MSPLAGALVMAAPVSMKKLGAGQPNRWDIFLRALSTPPSSRGLRTEHAGIWRSQLLPGRRPEFPRTRWAARGRDDDLGANHQPARGLQDGPVTKDYRVGEVHGAERITWWLRAVAAWPDFAEHQKKTVRTFPLFVLMPIDA